MAVYWTNYLAIWSHWYPEWNTSSHPTGRLTLPGLKYGPNSASFCLFSTFLHTMINIVNGNSVDGVLGIRTRDHWMVGADECTKLCRPPILPGLCWFVKLLIKLFTHFISTQALSKYFIISVRRNTRLVNPLIDKVVEVNNSRRQYWQTCFCHTSMSNESRKHSMPFPGMKNG